MTSQSMASAKKVVIHTSRFLLFGILIFLTFNRHSKSGYFGYQSEIWADKAGYYVYLPAATKFDFDARNFPDSIVEKTGYGFELNSNDNKVYTKYTSGVALLQLPFYLLADILAEPLSMERDGFSPIYHWSINVAAVFYLFMGLLMLNSFLKSRFSPTISFLVLTSILLATNLYYYSIDDTGMSHVYSFFLFSLYLYLLQKTNFLKSATLFRLLVFGLTCGLILLIRPTNILFILACFFLDLDNRKSLVRRIEGLLSLKKIAPIIIGVLLIILPQLFYWHYLTGSFFYYSYENEGFNWTDPKIAETLFAPRNGLITYIPFFIVILASMIYTTAIKNINGLLIFIVFIVLTYIFSCWWAWHFGCSFGGRSYVEYLALFTLPLAFLYEKLLQLKWYKSFAFWLVLVLLVTFNLAMTYNYDKCFFGLNDWDWNAYFLLVKDAFK